MPLQGMTRTILRARSQQCHIEPGPASISDDMHRLADRSAVAGAWVLECRALLETRNDLRRGHTPPGRSASTADFFHRCR